VLVVEDRYLIAQEIEAEVRKLGGIVVGPAQNLKAARCFLASHEIDLAVLDMDLAGDMVFPLAREFATDGKPFLFLTGHGDWILPPEWRDRPRLSKPVSRRTLRDALLKLRAHGAALAEANRR
jgi:DNA-binding NtrC family response regulator